MPPALPLTSAPLYATARRPSLPTFEIPPTELVDDPRFLPRRRARKAAQAKFDQVATPRTRHPRCGTAWWPNWNGSR